MLIAIGKVDINILLDSIRVMAQGQTTLYELNRKKGLGSWTHPDGWGVAYLQKGTWKIVKSTQAIYHDRKINSLRKVTSSVVLIHARGMDSCGVSLRNTHPFHEGKFVFCHNGLISGKINYDKKYKPKGETDSERLFYNILTNFDIKNPARSVRTTLLQFTKLTGTNIILASPQQTIVAVRENNYPIYFTMHIGKSKDAIIISSEKISSIKHMSWKPLSQGKVAVINNKERSISILKPKKLAPVEERYYR